MASGVQTLRFRHPTNKPSQNATPSASVKQKDASMLQDQTRRHDRPWCPSFTMAIRIFLLARFLAAMYSNISDCDEVFNFWEPLHYIDRGHAFQTWETSPTYAIRSYAYILLHLVPVRIGRIFGSDKRISFFAVRIVLALVSTIVEAKFYRSVVEKVNARVGRYLFFMLLFNAGMWSASTAFLPSTFGLMCNTLAFSYAIEPVNSKATRRTVISTFAFAAGAVVGWPFTLIMAIPFVFEELFLRGTDHVPSNRYFEWITQRWTRFASAAAIAALLFVPVVAIDSFFYGRLTVTSWNIIAYNLLPSGDSHKGPELYGTEPWYYYVLNLALAFNVILPLALAALPALAVTYLIDRRRLGYPASKDQSNQFIVLGVRLLPMYLWLGVLTAQPHKEERFAFPAYTMICFNAAVTLYLVRGWMEVAYIKATASPYRASRSSIFRITTFSVVAYTCLVSASRIMALWHNYHAPMTVAHAFETEELPRLLNVSGLLPEEPVKAHDRGRNRNYEDDKRVDLSNLHYLGLTLCVGKEWHRFPGSYLVPEGVNVAFVKSAFDGLVPGRYPPIGVARPELAAITSRVAGTRHIPKNQNDLNKEESSHYVDISSCDYLYDLDLPLHVPHPLEPRYIADEANWERVACRPFLDAANSLTLTRTLWFPGERWRSVNVWGEWCLLRRKGLDARAEWAGAAVKVQEKEV